MTVDGFTKWGMPCVIQLTETGEVVSARNYLHGELTPEQVQKPVLLSEVWSESRLVATNH